MGAQVLNHWVNFEDEAEEEEEETLSLCDLVMSSDANEYWNDHQQSFNSSSSSSTSSSSTTTTTTSDDQDFFEFFSEDFSTGNNNNKSIIFCGKLITYKDQDQSNIIKQQNVENGDRNSSSKSLEKKGALNKSLSMPTGPKNNKFKSENKKVSSVSSNSVKSRWHLFGVGRVSMEIELKDMKMRQSRISSSKAMRVQPPAATAAAAGGKPGNVKADKGGRRSAKGLWRLLKIIGCKNKHTNADVVKASFGCIPHV